MLNTSILTQQYTHTQSQAPEDECTNIRNMFSKIKQVTSVGLSLFNYQDDALSNKHKIHNIINFVHNTNVKSYINLHLI